MARRSAEKRIAVLAVVALAAAAALSQCHALELPDQLTLDFPGRGPGDASDGGRPTDQGIWETQASGGVFGGIPSGAEWTEGTSDFMHLEDVEIGSATESGGPRATSGARRPSGLNEDLEILGTISGTLRGSAVSGSSTTYSQQFTDTGSFDRRASFTANGRLWDAIPLYLKGTANIRPYAPTTLDWTLIWHEDSFDVTYGDVRADFTRNSFASIQRQTRGVTIVGDIGSRGTYQFFGTETKGITRKDTIAGEGTSGPYYLRHTPIREETAKVRIDNQDIPRGRYHLDPDSGLLQFLDGLIVAQTSVIEVVYEENRAGSARGRYWGVTADYRLGSLPVSVTYITQDIAGAAQTSDESMRREEEFFPNNTTGPFYLSYRPVDTTQPIVAYIDGAAREQDVDFEFYPESGIIHFFNIVPASASLRIVYYSFETEGQADTKKELIGFDTGYSWDNVSVGYSWARSQGGLLTDGTEAPGGEAWNTRMSYSSSGGDLNALLSYQQQDAGFSRIESTTFDADRSGWDASVRYRASENLNTYFRASRANSRTGLATGAGSDTGDAVGLDYRTGQLAAGADYSDGETRVSVSYNDVTSGRPTVSDSSRKTYSAAASRKLGSLDLSTAFVRSDRTSLSYADDEDEEDEYTRTTSDSARASLSYRWGARGNRASLGWSDSNTRDVLGTGLDSRIKSITGNVTYLPTEDITLSYRRAFNDSWGATYLATSTDEDPEVTEARTFSDSTSLSLSYRASQSLSLQASASEDRYESEGGIGYMSDQTRRSASLDVGYDPSRSLRLNARYSWSQTTYLERSRGRTSHSGWGAGLTWSPSRDLSVSAGYDLSASVSPAFLGGSGDTGLTVLSENAYDSAYLNLDWSLSDKGRLSLDARSDRNRGDYDDSDRITLNLDYTHRLTDDVSLGLGGRWVSFRDRMTYESADEDRSYSALTYYAQVKIGF